jgi:hypothetical protein
MASRWSFRIPSGPKAQGAKQDSGRCACPASRSVGAGGSTCPPLAPCGCAAGVCMPTIRATSWRCAGRSWGKGRWRCPPHRTGRTRTTHGVRPIRSVVRSVGSRWCARPSSPARAPHHQPQRGGSRWPEGEKGRGRLGVDSAAIRVACSRARGDLCELDRATAAPTPADGSADRPGSRCWAPHKGATPGWNRRPNSIAPETVTPRSVRGPSNPALKRTAAGSGVPLSIGPAAA